jgi:gluconate kinase
MLLMLGGYIGSGRKTLAQELSDKHGFHLFDADRLKLKRSGFNAKGEFEQRNIRNREDHERLFLLRKIAAEFGMLSKLHENVVVSGIFHRAEPREFLLDEARKYFEPVIFVWIDTDETSAQARLERMATQKQIGSVEMGMRRRDKSKKKFQPLAKDALLFYNEHDCARELLHLIDGKIARGI